MEGYHGAPKEKPLSLPGDDFPTIVEESLKGKSWFWRERVEWAQLTAGFGSVVVLMAAEDGSCRSGFQTCLGTKKDALFTKQLLRQEFEVDER
jgi:hypothetical protein